MVCQACGTWRHTKAARKDGVCSCGRKWPVEETVESPARATAEGKKDSGAGNATALLDRLLLALPSATNQKTAAELSAALRNVVGLAVGPVPIDPDATVQAHGSALAKIRNMAAQLKRENARKRNLEARIEQSEKELEKMRNEVKDVEAACVQTQKDLDAAYRLATPGMENSVDSAATADHADATSGQGEPPAKVARTKTNLDEENDDDDMDMDGQQEAPQSGTDPAELNRGIAQLHALQEKFKKGTA